MWTVIILADPVYKVWPRDQFAPCEITIPDEDLVLNLTSLTYPVQFIEALGFKPAQVPTVRMLQGYIEALGYTSEVTSVLLRQILKSYDDWPPEGIEYVASEVTSVLLRQILKSYDDWPPEGIEYSASEVTSISLENKLITYENWPAEGMEFAPAEITSISLITP